MFADAARRRGALCIGGGNIGCSDLWNEHPDMQHQSLKLLRRIMLFQAVFFGAG
jgi:hypothetical protein